MRIMIMASLIAVMTIGLTACGRKGPPEAPESGQSAPRTYPATSS